LLLLPPPLRLRLVLRLPRRVWLRLRLEALLLWMRVLLVRPPAALLQLLRQSWLRPLLPLLPPPPLRLQPRLQPGL
jgi:hypothetical protein